MNGKAMEEYLRGNKELLMTLLDEKLEIIRNSIKEEEVYIETNHAFIKGFAWEIAKKIPHAELAVIWLKRDLNAVVDSFFRIGTTPLDYSGLMWMYNPLMEAPETKIAIMFKIEYRILFFFNRFLKSKYNKRFFKFKKSKYFIKKEIDYLKWYIKETDLQAKKFKEKFPDIKLFELETKNLNTPEVYKSMFDFFGIKFSPKDSFYSSIGKTTNLKVNPRK
jgi:hypothetical protein